MKQYIENPKGRPDIHPKSMVKTHSISLPRNVAENWFHLIVEEDLSITFIWADPDELVEDSELGENSENK